MAFNYLGTLSITQLQELRSFLEAQLEDITEEINYLYVEMNNLSSTLAEFSEADTFFGGEASTSLYRTELHDVRRMTKHDDSPAAELMEKIKKPFIPTIKYKRERNEYKIKKLFDAIEQTKEAIDRKSIAKGQTKSLLNELERMFNSKNSTFLFKSEEDRKNFLQGIQL
jgi:hypothetical protein